MVTKAAKIIDVKFDHFANPQKDGVAIKGLNPEYRKLILVSHHAKRFPAIGETWVCRIIHDTKPTEPRRGVLFVLPLQLTKVKRRFVVAWDGQVPDLWPRVTRNMMLGRQTLQTVSALITSKQQICEDWPAWVVETVEGHLINATSFNRAEATRRQKQSLVSGLKRDADGKVRFQWAGDFLTDGQLWFPRVRPQGLEWRQLPIQAIPEGYWETFLNGLEGKLNADLLAYHSGKTWLRPARPRVLLTQRQEEITETIKAVLRPPVKDKEMWRGEGVDAVAVGKCVVFFVPRPGRPDLYVVDNPGPGAIYHFLDKAKAYELAQNLVTRTALIKSGAKRIMHRSGWREKLTRIVAAA